MDLHSGDQTLVVDENGFGIPKDQLFWDGTNVALSKDHWALLLSRHLPWFGPHESVASPDLETDLGTIRDKLRNCVLKRVFGVVALQRHTPFFPQPENWNSPPPPINGRLEGFQTGLSRQASQLFDSSCSVPLEGEWPFVDFSNKPIIDQFNAPIGMRFGLNRSFRFLKDNQRSGSFESLKEVFHWAASLLLRMPPKMTAVVWSFWLHGFRIPDDKSLASLWLDFVFELGWRMPKGHGLSIDRSAWVANFGIVLPPGALIPRIPKMLFDCEASFERNNFGNSFPAHLHCYPAEFYSVIPNIAHASLLAVDWLLSTIRRVVNPDDRPLPKWDGESRTLTFQTYSRKFPPQTGAKVITVLNAFQEFGWRSREDNPLNSHATKDTLQTLNSDQSCPLRFEKDGDQIIWLEKSA